MPNILLYVWTLLAYLGMHCHSDICRSKMALLHMWKSAYECKILYSFCSRSEFYQPTEDISYEVL